MEPLVKDYLRTHTFRQLEDEHGVFARFNSDFNKVSLNYDQIHAKSGDHLSEQCRGMVVRPHKSDLFVMMTRAENRDWKDILVGEIDVLAWPMCRFYNHGDSSAADIDWSHPTLKVYEKVDGTCIICYWDLLQEKWHAATRSVSEADIPINLTDMAIGDMTFSQLFLKALVQTREEQTGMRVDWEVDGPDKVIMLDRELTYVFELVSPHNQIVVEYPEPRVYLLAARHTATGKELPIEELCLQHVRRPKTWAINNVVALAAFVDTASPAELEGAVVCVQEGDSFKRQKVKNKSYVLAHRSKDSVTASPRNALEAVILEKVDDIIPLIPKEVGDKIFKMQEAYGRYCKSIDENFNRFREEAGTNRKHFAGQVMLSGDWTAPYFNLWEKRSQSTREWIRKTCDDNKMSDKTLDIILSRLGL